MMTQKHFHFAKGGVWIVTISVCFLYFSEYHYESHINIYLFVAINVDEFAILTKAARVS